MKKIFITIHHSIFINKPKDIVWDYTQDYTRRAEWDKSILEATTLQTTPFRIVRLKIRGGTTLNFVYKLDDRPNKTTLTIQEVDSKWITGGGGSWSYEEKDGGTIWSQTNTILLKSNFLITISLPFLTLLFKKQIHNSMRRAKFFLERK